MEDKEWGLTKKGYRRPEYTELVDSLERKARELWGTKLDLTVRSFTGLSIRLYAWMLDKIFQLCEDVYNSKFVDTAIGTSLYQIGRTIGLNLLPAQKATGYLEITGTPGTAIPAGFLAATVVGTQYVVLSGGKIGQNGRILLPIRAFEAGPDGNAEPDTITEIVNPTDDNILSITNPQRIDGGRWAETDEEYRDRYYKSVDFAGGVNADAIRAELLQTVDGIYNALVLENDTDFPDLDGLPPHSIECICYGGLDQEVAKAIFHRKAAGIQTFGNRSIDVVTKSGQVLPVCFSRPATVPVWIQVENLITGDSFPLDGEEQIRLALVQYVGGEEDSGLDIGKALYLKRLPAVLHNVSGVIDFDLSLSRDGTLWEAGNIVFDKREKAITSPERILIRKVADNG